MNLKAITEAGIQFNILENEDPVPSSSAVPRRSDPVFYNKKQNLNRDLSLIVMHASKDLGLSKLDSICETFSGSGIRALRYSLQGPTIKNIYVNDISPRSISLTKDNFAVHKANISTNVHYYTRDAKLFFLDLRSSDIFLDFIDIDPYGTPQPFMRNALLTIEPSGILAVTATDMPVITGLYPEKAYRLYQIPQFKVKNRSYCHEVGLRMFISYLQREALFYKLPFVPILSFYADHYVRVFLHHDQNISVDKIIQSHGYISDCSSCGKRDVYTWKDSFKVDHVCSNCQKPAHLLGPLYLGPLHSSKLISKITEKLPEYSKQGFIDRRARIERLIPLFTEDLCVDIPWYYQLGDIGHRMSYTAPSPQILIDKLKELGYKASFTHFDGQAVKTDFPLELRGKELKI